MDTSLKASERYKRTIKVSEDCIWVDDTYYDFRVVHQPGLVADGVVLHGLVSSECDTFGQVLGITLALDIEDIKGTPLCVEVLIHEATHVGQHIAMDYVQREGLDINDECEIGAHVTGQVAMLLLQTLGLLTVTKPGR